jgi:hypothetical protein
MEPFRILNTPPAASTLNGIRSLCHKTDYSADIPSMLCGNLQCGSRLPEPQEGTEGFTRRRLHPPRRTSEHSAGVEPDSQYSGLRHEKGMVVPGDPGIPWRPKEIRRAG